MAKILLTGSMLLISGDGLNADEMVYREKKSKSMKSDRKFRQVLMKK